jgi:DtxR family Mn-dependent transcriptional regulator
MLSDTVEDYLKTIYKLQWGHEELVTTSAIAERLGLSAAAVTGMVKKLAELGLVRHTRYHGVELTPAGLKVALEVIRHHRLIELYLIEALGLSWDQVHDEAEKLEHVLSEEVEERIAQALGWPTRDPHGGTIPTKDGVVDDTLLELLSELGPGACVVVRQVSDRDAEMLRYLGGLGLKPGAAVNVMDRAPFNGPLRIRVGADEHVLGRELASRVRVEVCRPGAR